MKRVIYLPTLICCLFFAINLSGQQIPGKSIALKKADQMNFKERAAWEKKQVIKKEMLIPPDEKLGDEEDWTKPKIIEAFEANKTVLPSNIIIPTPVNNTNSPQEVFPCNNFVGTIVYNAEPPDANGTAGFDHLMTTINSSVRIMQKNGNGLSEVGLTTFWSSTGHSDIFDPKITYDPYNQRWIFVCCASRKSINSSLLLGVSQSYDPTGNWNIYNIKADLASHLWFDYPSLGFNMNWITVGGNMYQNPGDSSSPRTSRIWVFNKADIYAGAATTYHIFDRQDLSTICPAITYSNSENTEWFVTNWNNNSAGNGYVKILSITGSVANPVLNLNNSVLVGPAWSNGGVYGTQANVTDSIDLGDDRMQHVVFRNSNLWFTQTICLPVTNPVTSAVQIGNVNPGTGIMNEGVIQLVDFSGATKCVYPTITVNKDNDLCTGYSTIYSAGYPSAQVTIRRNGDPTFYSYVYKAGESWYGNTGRWHRWGDYSATYTDPEDDKTMWTTSEYPRFNHLHGTWWAKICPNFCTNDYVLSGIINNTYQKYEANNTIISTAEIQTNSFIKYDAGTKITLSPGFKALAGTKLKAYIEGCGGIQ